MGGRKQYSLLGKRFGRLLVVEQAESKSGFTQWRCKCDCGKTAIVQGTRLVHGHTKSCGCLVSDVVIARNKRGMKYETKNNRIYRIYWGMRTRCYNAKDHNYPRYGGRGITICEEWLNDSETFKDWSLANGYRDDLSIDRIDNDGNYEPSNCRWATFEQQQENKTNPGSHHKPVRQITTDGKIVAEFRSINEASRLTGTSASTISGWCKGKRQTPRKYKWEYI